MTQVQLVEKIEVVGGYVKRILEKRMDKMIDMNFDVGKVFQERLASSMGLDKYRYIMEQVSITNVAVDTVFNEYSTAFI